MNPIVQGYRLSIQQKLLWLRHQPTMPRLHSRFLLEGPLQKQQLIAALSQLLRRHEILRTRFECLEVMDVPVQVVLEPAEVNLPEVDLTGFAVHDQQRQWQTVHQQSSDEPFAARLFRLAEEKHVLELNLSALCADDWSAAGLLKELAQLYTNDGDETGLPEVGVQYVDFSEWQSELAESEEEEEGRAYWRKQKLWDIPPVKLPLERNGAATENVVAQHVESEIDETLKTRLEALAAQQQTTLQVLLLACWQVLLWRLSNEPEVIIEVAFDQRKYSELDGAIGLYKKYLPLKAAFEESFSFVDALRQVQQNFSDADEWQVNFYSELLQQADAALRQRAADSISYQYSQWPDAEQQAGVSFSLLSVHDPSEISRLQLACTDRADRLSLEFHYNPALYEQQTVELLSNSFVTLLASVADQSKQQLRRLDLLNERERQQLLEEWNVTAAERASDECVPRLFEAQVERTPQALAVIHQSEQLSYRELNEQANQLAHHLGKLGVGPEAVVGLCVERSVSLVVGLLAIMKAGGAYLPLEPADPPARIRYMLADAGARVLLTQSALVERLDPSGLTTICLDESGLLKDEPTENPAVEVNGEHLAYVIYTSGSTGQPKGVMVRHSALVNLQSALQHAIYADLPAAMRVSVNAPLSFDASVKQVVQLLQGHTIVVVPDELRLEAERLVNWLREQQVDVLDCTPGQLRVLLAAGLEHNAALRALLIGGEAIDASLWERLSSLEQTRCYNLYGPTECTVDATVRLIGGDAPRLGRALPRTQAYVLGPDKELLPVGVAGELYLSGAGLARGYLDQPMLTSERFIPHPYSNKNGARLYRTGDIVRWVAEGELEYLGRTDEQVKIRGNRLELREVEAVLKDHDSVRECVVVAREDEPGNKRLVAYVVARQLREVEAVNGNGHFTVGDGLSIAHHNRNETAYLYHEIFEKQSYLRHGVTLTGARCVFDVGANIGMFTLFAAQHAPHARIYAFEPLAPLCRTLRRNSAWFGERVKVFEHGLGALEEAAQFTYYPRYTMMSGMSAYADAAGEQEVIGQYLRNEQAAGVAGAGELLAQADEILAGRFTGERHECRLRRLSAVMREQAVEWIDLLKVDVQRAEWEVLCGIEEQDWQKIGQVVLEVHDTAAGAGRVADVLGLLRRQGYRAAAEQDELLVGTDRWNVYAVREGVKANGGNGHASTAPVVAPVERSLSRGELCAELRANLRARLPEYMVPAAIVLLEKLPLTRHGKVDRTGLPAPEAVATEEQRSNVTLTPVEELLAGIWSEVLRVRQIAATDNFFDLGGHSLLATQLTSRVREVFKVELPLRLLFEAPVLSELAARIEAALKAEAGLQTPPLRRAERGSEAAPLSFAQQRLWFLDQLEPNSSFYNSAMAVRLSGKLNKEALARTLSEIVRRHEVLRTSFQTIDGEPRQIIAPATPLPLPEVDLSKLALADREAEVRRLAQAEAARPFDLSRGPLLRVKLLHESDSEHVVLLTMHHIVSDGWSMGVFINEVATLYRAYAEQHESPLPELELQYTDYAIWQRGWLQGDALESQMRYWKTQLDEVVTLELPTDRPRSALQSRRGERHALLVPAELSRTLTELSRREGVTLFMTLLAALQVLLSRYSGQTDVAVGSPIAGRTRRELEPLIGFFVNTLVLRSRLQNGESFRSLLAQVKSVCLGAYAHQDVPFEKLVEELQPERDLTRSPLFQVALTLQNAPEGVLELPGLTLSGVHSENLMAKFDLTLGFSEDKAGQLHGSIIYAKDLFNEPTISRMGQHFVQLLAAIVETPERQLWQIPLLTAAEQAQLQTWNATGTDYPPHTSLHALIEQQVERTPTATAVSFAGELLSYRELNSRANQLARHLRQLGVKQDQLVGIAMERSLELVVALLAVLKAGAAYVPLDPEYPRERLAFMLQDANVTVLLTQSALLSQLPEHHAHTICLDSEWREISRASDTNPLVPISPDNLAYVIYTSGSTGIPKGAMNSHRAICNRLLWMQDAFQLTAHDRVLQKTPFSFDVSVWEFFWPLLVGAQLVVARPGDHRDSAYLATLIAEQQITTLHFVPSLLRVFLEEPEVNRGASLRRVICSGEALDHALQQRFFAVFTGVELHNLYGPTEAAVDVTAWQCQSDSPSKTVPIGRPIANLKIHLLDQHLQPVPVGVKGELYIGGIGLARGYWNRPALTAERFLPDPFSTVPGARLYRSGDEARYLPDGSIDYLGRLDHQVKIRGLRVELGEIAATLTAHPAIEEAIVVARDYGLGDTRLVAYLVPDQQRAFAIRELLRLRHSELSEQLYELPNGLIVVHQNKGETDFLYQEIFADQTYLKHVELPPDAVVFDVGANIGLFTLFAGRACNAATVYAFEPLPPLFKVLEANVRLHGVNVKLFECGLAQEARRESFTYYPHCTILSGRFANQQEESAVLKSYMLHDGSAAASEEMVGELLSERLRSEQYDCELRTISDVIAEHDIEQIDLLKIDVEKSELDVIAGIGAEDWKRIRQVIIEVHDRDGRLDAVGSLLARHGYEITIEQDSFLQQTELYNVYAVRRGTTIAKPAAEHEAQKHSWDNAQQLLTAVETHLQQKLPAYMTPAHFVLLHELPLNPNGKVDRQALPLPQHDQTRADAALDPPRTAEEEILLGLFQQVLKTRRVTIHDNFFALGGHSLLGTQLISRIREVFNVELPLRILFETPVLSKLALRIQEMRARGDEQIPPLRRIERGTEAVLSFAQQRLWFLDQLEPNSAFYNNPAAVRLSGDLNTESLRRTLAEIVRRHEVLRTTFKTVNGEPTQVIANDAYLTLPEIDLSHLKEPWQTTEARLLIQEEAAAPFDLSSDQLLRVKLLRLAPHDHVVLMTMHHIISDGWSIGVLTNEIGTLYRAYSEGRESSLPELEIQYADYAIWQRNWLQGEVLEKQVRYWKKQLHDLPALELPTDRRRPALQSYEGASYSFALPRELAQQLQDVSQREGTTLFMTLLAALQLLLARYSGQTDIAVGTPIAGRTRRELEPLIGFFVNTLVLRSQINGEETLAEFQAHVRNICLEAYAHQDVPFEKLVEELRPERDLSRSALFQVMLTVQNAGDAPFELPGLTITKLGGDSVPAKFDLSAGFVEDGQGRLRCSLTYATALFNEATIVRLGQHLTRVLEAIGTSADQQLRGISILTEAEQAQLNGWSATAPIPTTANCFHKLFEEQVQRAPDAIAIVSGSAEITYGELNRRANQLARYLKQTGSGPDQLVGLCTERSAEMVIGLLGALKAGAAYVPLDADHPPERLRYMLEQARIKVVLTQKHLAHLFTVSEVELVRLDEMAAELAQQAGDNLVLPVSEANLAYVIYTSGSTGAPKGVMIQHSSLTNFVNVAARVYEFSATDRVLQFASITFDTSVEEIYLSLVSGACLVLRNDEILASPEEFLRQCRAQRITVLDLPTAYWHELVAAGAARQLPESIRLTIIGGEKAAPERVRQWYAEANKNVRLFNGYGPTEATVVAVVAALQNNDLREREIEIGRPLGNVQLYVLDHWQNRVPAGVIGELYIGGAGLARGYLDRPQETAQSFVPDPFSARAGQRLFRTGDMVRYRDDGKLEYVGRRDQQVKLRGHRIELGEIETILRSHPNVCEAVVSIGENRLGERYLAAYVETNDARLTSSELREHLRRAVPDYMVPSAIIQLDHFPLNPSGKIDRRALPHPDDYGTDTVTGYEAPRTPIEDLLTVLWSDVLRVEQIGIHDNFFELGGHSLLAAKLVARIKESFGLGLPIRVIFEAQEIAALAEVLDRALRKEQAEDEPSLEPISRAGTLPLSLMQDRTWLLLKPKPNDTRPRRSRNMNLIFRISGELRVDVLKKALAEVARRHEILRITYSDVEGKLTPQIHPTLSGLPHIVDLQALDKSRQKQEALRVVTECSRRPFNLAGEFLLNGVLVRLSPPDHVLAFVIDHFIFDGWSKDIFLSEFAVLYDSFYHQRPSPLPEVRVQFLDWAHWQNERLRRKSMRFLDFWKQRLDMSHPFPTIELPQALPEPAVPTRRAQSQSIVLPPSMLAELEALVRNQRVTMFILLATALKALLHAYTGKEKIGLLSPTANRQQPETQHLVGWLSNLLILPTDLSGDPTFAELLERVRETCLSVYEHGDLPLYHLMELLHAESSALRERKIGSEQAEEPDEDRVEREAHALGVGEPYVFIAVQPSDQARKEVEQRFDAKFDDVDLRIEHLAPEADELVPGPGISINVTENTEGLKINAVSEVDRYQSETMVQFLNRYRLLLETVIADAQLRLSDLTAVVNEERTGS